MIADDTDSGLFQCSDSKIDDSRISSVDGTSNPKSLETYSVFGDGSCGEPLFAQHVIVDFTPNEETDTDFVQKKVCSFWQFINNAAEIQNLKVKPEKNIFKEDSNSSNVSESTKVEPESSKVVDDEIDRTAVDMLEFAEEKSKLELHVVDLIDRLFEAKMPISNCSLGSREYKEGEVIARPKKKDKKKQGCICKTDCASCPVHGAQKCRQGSSQSSIRLLSRKLNEWDAKHPKSMEPPGHAPPLQHCVIQRQVFPESL